ncbi:hypothetical protein [Rhizobium leguminosarum]|uniref:hypothetical protein n=1 Tax=Rhizobium TaxID=379 RepID=UPI00140F9C41|nr:hypothetical protein [Rhizobium leguminosarum]QIO67760.1 hypothetical protein HA462_22910 [Rhizobium leguminosarum bv. trifolii]
MTETSSRPEGDRIVIELYPGDPIALGDLSNSFAALARIYERHYRQGGESAPKLHITKLETGSILMEIAPYITMMGVLTIADNTVVVADFANRLSRGIKAFSSPADAAPPIDPPSIDDARDIREFTKPLLGKVGSSLGIKHARYKKTDGQKTVVVEYSFTEPELNRAAINIERLIDGPAMIEGLAEMVALSPPSEQIKREVMLFMDQANRHPGKESGRTGDRGIIPSISEKALPVYFRKSFQDIKGHMTRDVNPLTSTFVVDVHVQYLGNEPKGYMITDVHQAIPADDTE